MSSLSTTAIGADLLSVLRILSSTKPRSAILQYDDVPHALVDLSVDDKAELFDAIMGVRTHKELGSPGDSEPTEINGDGITTAIHGSAPWQRALREACLKLLEGTVRAYIYTILG